MEKLLKYFFIPIVIFVVAFLLMRIMGKKAAREMNGVDLIIVMVMGTAISEPIVSKKIGTAIWYSAFIAILYVVFSYLELNNTFKKWLVPKETILIEKGQISKQGLRREKIEIDQLLAQMRVNGHTDIKDIYRATMEQTGEISFIPNENARPLRPDDLQLQPTPTYIPIPIIIDGQVQKSNLHYVGKDQNWLQSQLNSNNLNMNQLNQVILATYNIRGFLDLIRIGK
jgi:uncharacterized membrane protein YcaP (DUF421 family)